MAKSKNAPASVEDFMRQLDHPLVNVVQALRKIILQTDKEIGEQIKWNSPAFYYTGEMKPFDPKEYKRDIVVFNLHKKEQVLLVFPTGAKINDSTELLEGKYTDGRRLMTFRDMKAVQSNEKALQTIIKEWLKLVEK